MSVQPATGDDKQPLATDGGPQLYEIALDGRALRTPARQPMHFESFNLAQAVALEWDSQGVNVDVPGMEKGISPASMPLMSLVSTWLDQTVPSRDIVEKNVSKFLSTDTVCFLADPDMRILRRRQVGPRRRAGQLGLRGERALCEHGGGGLPRGGSGARAKNRCASS